MKKIPNKCDVVVIGGGPAGSSAASHLALAGIHVVLLEQACFPRNQVGESLIPHFWKFTDMIGVSDKIRQEGFVAKSGAMAVWNDKVHQVKFSNFGITQPGLHVERDIFDNILLKHAESCEASVFTEVSVKSVDFSNSEIPRIFYADTREQGQKEGVINCQYVIDASGSSTCLAKQFKSRQTISSNLNFLAMWGYFTQASFVGADRKCYPIESLPNVKPVTFVMSCEGGWVWHIVLREKTSVGLIVPTERTKGMNRHQREGFFKQTCQKLPHLSTLLAPAQFVEGSLQFRPDYSYYSTQLCGENYYCIGDAAAFVDPIFSHGVQNSFYNAAVTTLAIKESLNNKKNRLRYSQLCESRMQQFYGFSRALSLGDFGRHGVNPALVKNLIKSLSPLELELILVASEMTNRSDNFRQLLMEAGVLDKFERNLSERTNGAVEPLTF